MCDRIVVLIDMDCFYCQVEARLNPSLKGKPLAVVQYNQWKGGGIIAVNYEARKFGVTRYIRGDEAKQKCQDIILVHVPAERGKADLTKYRDAGREVVNVLCQFSDCVERASVDEAYIDVTSTVEQRLKDGAKVTPLQLQHTFVVGLSDTDDNEEESRSQSVKSWLACIEELQDSVQLRLAVGAALVEEMRAAVYSQTGFECSAGIAHNKILSKLACGLHKPNRQTVLPQSGVNTLYETLPIKRIRSLGGKFGDVVVDQLGCTVMADLAKFSEKQLQQKFDGKTGTWLYNIARGIDNDRVTQRLVTKSIGCCKKFPGKRALGLKKDVEKWLLELAIEVSDRLYKDLQENKRRASLLTVSYSQDVDGHPVSSSRSGVLTSYEPQKIADDALELLKKSNTTPATLHWSPPLKYLGISVGKFLNLVQAPKIDTFFKNGVKKSDCDGRTELKCNISTDARNETKENTNNRERSIITIADDSNRNVSMSRVSSENKQHSSCSRSAVGYVGKQTEVSLGNATVSLGHISHPHPLTKSKKRILGSISPTSKSRSFFINYLRTKHLVPSDSRSGNPSFTKCKFDSDSVVKSSDLQPSRTSRHSEIVDATGVDQITSAQGSSNNKENGTDKCISVHELFPNLSQADSDIVELLPTQMRKQVRARKLAKRTEIEAGASECSPVERCSETVAVSSSNSSLPENNVNVVVNVHRNSSPEKPHLSGSVETFRRTENMSDANFGLLSSLQEDETAILNQRFQIKRLSESEIPFKNTDGQPDRAPCSSAVDGNVHNYLDNLKSNDATLPICVGKSATSEKCFADGAVASTSSTLQELCHECKTFVPLKDFSEHLDFHLAESLQKELDSEPVRRPAACRVPQQISGTKKRGRCGKKQGTSSVDKKMRSITTFFAPR